MKQKSKLFSVCVGIIAVLISLLFMVLVFDPLMSQIYFRYFSYRSSQISLLSFFMLIFLIVILPRLLSGVVTGAITRKKSWQWGVFSGLFGFFINLISGSIILNVPSAIGAFIIYLSFAGLGGFIGEQLSEKIISKMFTR